MNALSPIVTPEALERAGLRLDAAASRFAEYCSQPAGIDDDADERLFSSLDHELGNARIRYRALLEVMTGGKADEIEWRLAR